MRNVSLVLLVLLAGCAAAPTATSDADVARQFGMLGEQALDCSAPPSPSNPHGIYSATPTGGGTRTLRMRPELDGTFPMRNLRLAGANQLAFEESSRGSEFAITVAKIDGRFRSWRSVRDGSQVLVDAGMIVGSGSPTLAFTLCR